MSVVLTEGFAPPPINKKEILRYAGARCADARTESLMDECIAEAEGCLVYNVCYTESTVSVGGGACVFDGFEVKSEGLSKNLSECRRALLFGATVGVGLDRLIAKYSIISPAKAVMLQAVGAERIEALCDEFCRTFEEKNKVALKPRFSPGYGDLSLECQKDIFVILGLNKNIGVTLNGSLLMTPLKSVTAFAGITDFNTQKCKTDKCAGCDRLDCAFRGRI